MTDMYSIEDFSLNIARIVKMLTKARTRKQYGHFCTKFSSIRATVYPVGLSD